MNGGADFTRTCEGCENVITETWTNKKECYRCNAPGRCMGYMVGVGRYLPYVPAWCPKMKEEA